MFVFMHFILKQLTFAFLNKNILSYPCTKVRWLCINCKVIPGESFTTSEAWTPLALGVSWCPTSVPKKNSSPLRHTLTFLRNLLNTSMGVKDVLK